MVIYPMEHSILLVPFVVHFSYMEDHLLVLECRTQFIMVRTRPLSVTSSSLVRSLSRSIRQRLLRLHVTVFTAAENDRPFPLLHTSLSVVIYLWEAGLKCLLSFT